MVTLLPLICKPVSLPAPHFCSWTQSALQPGPPQTGCKTWVRGRREEDPGRHGSQAGSPSHRSAGAPWGVSEPLLTKPRPAGGAHLVPPDAEDNDGGGFFCGPHFGLNTKPTSELLWTACSRSPRHPQNHMRLHLETGRLRAWRRSDEEVTRVGPGAESIGDLRRGSGASPTRVSPTPGRGGGRARRHLEKGAANEPGGEASAGTGSAST